MSALKTSMSSRYARGGGTAPVGGYQQLAEQGHSIGCRFLQVRPCAGKTAPSAKFALSSQSHHQDSPAHKLNCSEHQNHSYCRVLQIHVPQHGRSTEHGVSTIGPEVVHGMSCIDETMATHIQEIRVSQGQDSSCHSQAAGACHSMPVLTPAGILGELL